MLEYEVKTCIYDGFNMNLYDFPLKLFEYEYLSKFEHSNQSL